MARFSFTLLILSLLSTKLHSHRWLSTGSIGILGSMSIAANSLTGPAMLSLPATFARSGIIPTTFVLVSVCYLSALCSLHMANSISKVRGNADFKRNVEFSQAFTELWDPRCETWTQLLFWGCVTCLNVSSIVDTSQVVDTFLGHWFPYGGTAAILVESWNHAQFVRWDYDDCPMLDLAACVPFQQYHEQGILLTTGNLITTLAFFPLAMLDLTENAAWQIVGFLILLVTSAQFVFTFLLMPELSLSNVTWWGTDWTDLLGVVLFNFALVIAIPAWLYERDSDVDIETVVYGSSVLSTFLYVLIGLLGSCALPWVSDNMLETLMSGALGPGMQLGASIFAFAIIGLGIPLFSVLSRLNVMGHPRCTRRIGNILAVYFPFALSWVLHDGTAITKLLSWGGVIFTSLVAFILPLTLAIHSIQKLDVDGSVDVYSFFGPSREGQLRSLWVLLAIASVSIAIALAGDFWDATMPTDDDA